MSGDFSSQRTAVLQPGLTVRIMDRIGWSVGD
jgi:hypothetical protein